MDTSLWSVHGDNKARLNVPLALTNPHVVEVSARLTAANQSLGTLRGAFRSTPMQPHAGIPIFGLVLVIAVGVLSLAIWLAIFDRNGILARGLTAGALVAGSVLTVMGLGLLLYSGSKLRRLVADLRQLLLIFDNGLAHVRPEQTSLYYWSEIKELRHQSVQLQYGGMDTGVEHAYVVVAANARELILLGRCYAPANDQPGEGALTDVQQVGDFIGQKVALR